MRIYAPAAIWIKFILPGHTLTRCVSLGPGEADCKSLGGFACEYFCMRTAGSKHSKFSGEYKIYNQNSNEIVPRIYFI